MEEKLNFTQLLQKPIAMMTGEELCFLITKSVESTGAATPQVASILRRWQPDKTIMKEPYAMNQTKFISRRTFLTGVSAAAIAAASPALFAAPKPKAKALIILFSRSGNTAYLAERIHAETGAPILRIEPKVPYTKADLNWMDKQSRSTFR